MKKKRKPNSWTMAQIRKAWNVAAEKSWDYNGEPPYMNDLAKELRRTKNTNGHKSV